jgi:hypothetical protein
MNATESKADMDESKEEAGAAAPRPRRHVDWTPMGPRVEEILDSCEPARKIYTDVDGEPIPGLNSEETKTRTRKRDLLRPLAKQIAAMEADLKQSKVRDAKYFALLKAYRDTLTTFKKL